MPILSKTLFEYILYQQNNPRKALELASLASAHHEFKDWWWKAAIGKCFCWLGMFRDAERQLKSALSDAERITVAVELGKIYLKRDQPKAALELYQSCLDRNPGSVSLLIAIARIHEATHDLAAAEKYYRQVLSFDNANVEAISCLASNCFYSDQPEVALLFYRRLLQMGVESAEIWTNLGLCCFYAQQYDMTLGSFERALGMASDDVMADVWYNIGHVALGLGDIPLAYQCWKIAVASDHNHAESYCNLGILELYRNGNVELARVHFSSGLQNGPHLYENFYNAALLAYQQGEYQSAIKHCKESLEVYPGHVESQALLKSLLE